MVSNIAILMNHSTSIDPGCLRRNKLLVQAAVTQLHVWLDREKVASGLWLVRGEIVQDDVTHSPAK